MLAGEELERATAVLEKLKTRDSSNISFFTAGIPSPQSPYEFLRKLEQERLLGGGGVHRTKNLAVSWDEQKEPQLKFDIAEKSRTPCDIVCEGEEPLRLCRDCRCLGIRLLKMTNNKELNSSSSSVGVKTVISGLVLPMVRDTHREISSSSSPGDLAAVVRKLRDMRNTVAQLQSNLGDAFQSAQRQQKQQQKPLQERESSKPIKLERFGME